MAQLIPSEPVFGAVRGGFGFEDRGEAGEAHKFFRCGVVGEDGEGGAALEGVDLAELVAVCPGLRIGGFGAVEAAGEAGG